MPWYHRTSPRRARSILAGGFDASEARNRAKGIWLSDVIDVNSADNALRDGAGAIVILAVDVPDAVVKAQTIYPDELDDRGPCVPSDVLSGYPVRLKTHFYEGDTRAELLNEEADLVRVGNSALAGHVRDLIDLLTELNQLP